MKRAPLVLAGTALGVIGVVGYHTAEPSSAGSLTGSTAHSGSAGAGSTAHSASASAGTAAASSSTSTTSRTTTTTATKASKPKAVAKTRTATGEDVSYQYGDLQVKVTMSGKRVTNVSVIRLDVTDPHSESIDQVAVPELRAQALSAQSGSIDGVSGASYTSAAYKQSLQSAIDKLSSASASA